MGQTLDTKLPSERMARAAECALVAERDMLQARTDKVVELLNNEFCMSRQMDHYDAKYVGETVSKALLMLRGSTPPAAPKRETEIPGVEWDGDGRAYFSDIDGNRVEFAIGVASGELYVSSFHVDRGGAQVPIQLLQRFVDTGKLTNGGDK